MRHTGVSMCVFYVQSLCVVVRVGCCGDGAAVRPVTQLHHESCIGANTRPPLLQIRECLIHIPLYETERE